MSDDAWEQGRLLITKPSFQTLPFLGVFLTHVYLGPNDCGLSSLRRLYYFVPCSESEQKEFVTLRLLCPRSSFGHCTLNMAEVYSRNRTEDILKFFLKKQSCFFFFWFVNKQRYANRTVAYAIPKLLCTLCLSLHVKSFIDPQCTYTIIHILHSLRV